MLREVGATAIHDVGGAHGLLKTVVHVLRRVGCTRLMHYVAVHLGYQQGRLTIDGLIVPKLGSAPLSVK